MTINNNTSKPLFLYYTPRSTRPYWMNKRQVDETLHISKWMNDTPGMFPHSVVHLRRHGIWGSCQVRHPVIHEYHTRYLSSFVKMTYGAWQSMLDACFPHVCRSRRVSIKEHRAMEEWLCKNVQGDCNFLPIKGYDSLGNVESLGIRFHRPEDHLLWKMVWE